MVTRQQVTSSSISNSRWIMSAIEQQAAGSSLQGINDGW
jgi:hypothetical protein